MTRLIIKIAAFFILAGSIVHFSCTKEYSCEGCRDTNQPPLAIAGPDTTIVLPTDSVWLDGSASSDPDGTIGSFQWIKITGPHSIKISNSTAEKTIAKNLAAGIYQFELKVTDDEGLSAKDTMQVIVDSVLTANHPPIADAGADQTITLPRDTIRLDGGRSTDPENNISGYLWTKIAGPLLFNIANGSMMQTGVSNLVQGDYQFQLKVTDAGGLFSMDTIQVHVNAAASNNHPPFAIAGNDTTLQSNQATCAPVQLTITLNGSRSYDPDGAIVSYLWSGPGIIANPNSAITTITGSFQGTISFMLKVTDRDTLVASDTIQISIIPANRPLIQARLIPVARLPEARESFALAAAGNKLLVAGGSASLSQGCASARVDIYDITSGLWSVAQLSEGRQGAGVEVLDNKVFFAGGIIPEQLGSVCAIWNNVRNRSSALDIYDATANTWTTAQLTRSRCPVVASAGRKVLIAGGEATFPVSGDRAFEIYDAGTNAWTNTLLKNVGVLRQPVVAGNKIYYAGGIDDGRIGNAWDIWGSKRIDIFDVSAGLWSIDSLTIQRAEMGAILANNKIYWAGGYVWDPSLNDYSRTDDVEIKDLATNITYIDCLSEPKDGITAVKKDDMLIFFGGLNSARFDIYHLTTRSWSIGVLPQNLRGASVISSNNSIYVAGGSVNNVLSDRLWKLEF